MKQLGAAIAAVLESFFFFLFECTGFFFRTGLAISFGLYCQFECPIDVNGLLCHILAVPSLEKISSLLSSYSNSAVQTLEILFLFSSMILVMYHIRKIFDNPSMKACL